MAAWLPPRSNSSVIQPGLRQAEEVWGTGAREVSRPWGKEAGPWAGDSVKQHRAIGEPGAQHGGHVSTGCAQQPLSTWMDTPSVAAFLMVLLCSFCFFFFLTPGTKIHIWSRCEHINIHGNRHTNVALAKHRLNASAEREFSWIQNWFPWQEINGFHNLVKYFQITAHPFVLATASLHISTRWCVFCLASTEAEFLKRRKNGKWGRY